MSMINEFVEEIKAKINHKKEYHKNFYEKLGQTLNDNDLHKATQFAFDDCMEFINELAEKYRDFPDTNVGKWIPVSEALPDAETEVLILARRKYTGGEIMSIITTAIYEDGTVLENGSIWHWDNLDGEWNEEEDCYIIPEGWWEYRHYNMDETYNNAIDDEVIAWQPLPQPYKGE